MSSLTRPMQLSIGKRQESDATHSQRRLHASRFAFWALCLMLLSQMYLVPILPVGPSWAIFPTIQDITILLMFGAGILYRGQMAESHRPIWHYFIVIFAVFLLNYLTLTIWSDWLGLRYIQGSEGLVYGANSMYRLVQMGIAFWVISRIPMTVKRYQSLERIMVLVIVVNCILIFLVFFEVVTPAQLSAQLPDNLDVSGPWAGLYRKFDVSQDGLGTISYNHGIVASQVLLMMGLLMSLSRGKNTLRNYLLMILCIGATFVSGSRTGFVAMLIFTMIMLVDILGRSPLYFIAIFLVAIGGILFAFAEGIFEEVFEDAIQRQAAIVDSSAADSGNFSGRTDFWKAHIELLNRNLGHWVWGSGLGTARDSGFYSHNNYLSVIFELGLIGLMGFLLAMGRILRSLWRWDFPIRGLFWTVIVLLFTALTLDVFHPVPHRGQWLPFFMACLALSLYARTVHEQDPVVMAQSSQ